MVILSVLNRIYNFAQARECPKQCACPLKLGLCPKQGIYFRNFFVLNRVRV